MVKKKPSLGVTELIDLFNGVEKAGKILCRADDLVNELLGEDPEDDNEDQKPDEDD